MGTKKIERLRARRYRQDNKIRYNETQQRQRDRRRYKVIEHYSNDTFQCACCGESIYEFLTIDHIDGNGAKHRKQVGDVNRWIIANNYPPGFQILCYNCNCTKGYYGICPHQSIAVGTYQSPNPVELFASTSRRFPPLTYKDHTQTIGEWAEGLGINPNTIRQRLNLGWNTNKALSTPVSSHTKRTTLTYNGQTKSLKEWAIEMDIRPGTLSTRLSRGWEVGEALNTPVFGVGQYRLSQRSNRGRSRYNRPNNLSPTPSDGM